MAMGSNMTLTGYQIQYSTSKIFASGSSTKKVAGTFKISKTITGLKKERHTYSAWSSKKKVKISK